MPTTYKDPGLPPVLVYSIGHTTLDSDAEPGPSLAALLGRTRARVLMTVAITRCNTSELAELTDIALATASQHASVLRASGLITSTRAGKSQIHEITPLGLGVIEPADSSGPLPSTFPRVQDAVVENEVETLEPAALEDA